MTKRLVLGFALATTTACNVTALSVQTPAPTLATRAPAPAIALPSHQGGTWDLATARAGHHVALVFYRGHW